MFRTLRYGIWAFAAGMLVAGGVAWAEGSVKLRLLETTDIHGNAVDYDYYADRPTVTAGLNKVATLIKQARAENPNTVLIDNGDLIQGNPLGDLVAKRRGLKPGEVHPLHRAMRRLGYDVGNIGNHEFNYGLDLLETVVAGAGFPYVSANIYRLDGDDDPSNDPTLVNPYVLLDRKVVDETGETHDLRIGVIGFVPPQVMAWDKANLEGRVRAADIVESARRYIPEMKAKGADVIVAVPHSGLDVAPRRGMDENAAYYLTQVAGIDALLFGHSHKVFPGAGYDGLPGVDVQKGTINGVAAVIPGFWGSHLGVVDLTLAPTPSGGWTVVGGVSEARPIYRRDGREKIALVAADEETTEIAREAHEATVAYMRETVGRTAAPITSYFALVADDPSIQIVTNAQKWYLERMLADSPDAGLPILSAGAPFKAGGRGGPEYYTDIPAGEIALKNVSDLYIYPNTVRAVRLSGAQVVEWLEMSAGAFNRIDPTLRREQPLLNPDFPSYNYDVIDGIRYRIDLTQPARYDRAGELVAPNARRIVDVTFNDAPLDPDMMFVVATNNYRAGGGGNFPALDGSTTIFEAPDENRAVLADYIQSRATINPSADNNWGFVPLPETTLVTFASSPKAATLLGQGLPVASAGMAENGFGKYRLVFK